MPADANMQPTKPELAILKLLWPAQTVKRPRHQRRDRRKPRLVLFDPAYSVRANA